MRNYTIGRLAAQIMLAFFLFFGNAPNPGWANPAVPRRDWDIPRPSKFVKIDYGTIDAYARATPESAARSLNTLSEYLTAPARSELAKARSVYAWITAHVRYDESAFSGQRYSSEEAYANRVLRSRKAVCTGFALLYKHLLNRAGIEVVTIKGYSRTDDRDAGQPIAQIDHEWNAVRLEGNWYLLDLAWAQTTARPGPDGNPLPNDFFFLTDPGAFVANHFPADSRWQLLDPVISKAQFDQFPKLYDAYFRLGFDPAFPKTGLIRAGDALTLTLRNDQDVEFMGSLGRRGGSVANHVPVNVQQSGGSYQLTVPIQQRGNSTLTVFARPKGPRSERVKAYEAIASFTVIN